MTVARFSPDGLQVYVGTSAGDVAIFNLRTKNVGRVWTALVRSNPKLTTRQLIHREKLSGTSAIKHLEFDSSGR